MGRGLILFGGEKMPNTLHMLDASFPRFTGQEKEEQKIGAVMDYLQQLQEQLRYILNNLGSENFNETALGELSDGIVKPVIQELKSIDGKVSRLSQTVDGFTLEVENGKDSSVIRLMAGEAEIASQEIKFTGVVTFTSDEYGYSRIDGGNLYSYEIVGREITVWPEDRTGEFVRIKQGGISFASGGIKDAQLDFGWIGLGDSGFAIHSYELADISVDAAGDLNLGAGGNININGTVYINGQLFGG